MFSFSLAQDFKQRAQTALPFPRGLIAAIAARRVSLRMPPLGTFVSLGAVALGAALMFANFVHERRAAAAAVAAVFPPPAPAVVPPVVAAAPAPVVASTPDPIAAVAAAPAPTPVAEKMVQRVDTTPLGAIAEPSKPKKHKHHAKKADANP